MRRMALDTAYRAALATGCKREEERKVENKVKFASILPNLEQSSYSGLLNDYCLITKRSVAGFGWFVNPIFYA